MRLYACRLRRFALACGIVALCLAGQAGAVTITLEASQDNTVFESNTGALSNGAGRFFFAGRNGGGGGQLIMRGLVQFDVASRIPPGATINSVALALNVSTPMPHTGTVTLHPVLAPWGEGLSVGGGMGEAAGAAPTVGDATWIHTYFNTALWATPGGDFRPEASASLAVGGIGPHVVDSTPELVADVQAWLNNPGSNNGWLFRLSDEAAPAIRFDSRNHGNPSVRPRLVVDFTLPTILISPGTGIYALTQVSDLVIFLNPPAGVTPIGAMVLLDGVDVSTDFAACLLSGQGTVVGGGLAFRCPSQSFADIGVGMHTFDVTLTLSDASTVQQSVNWVVVETTEP